MGENCSAPNTSADTPAAMKLILTCPLWSNDSTRFLHLLCHLPSRSREYYEFIWRSSILRRTMEQGSTLATNSGGKRPANSYHPPRGVIVQQGRATLLPKPRTVQATVLSDTHERRWEQDLRIPQSSPSEPFRPDLPRWKRRCTRGGSQNPQPSNVFIAEQVKCEMHELLDWRLIHTTLKYPQIGTRR